MTLARPPLGATLARGTSTRSRGCERRDERRAIPLNCVSSNNHRLVHAEPIHGQLLRDAAKGAFAPFRFYVKRWLRTLPPYYFMLVLLLVPNGAPLSTLLSHALFAQTYLQNNWYLVSWSLCVEEHFYLLLPLLIVVLRRWHTLATVVALVAGAEAIAIACRVIVFSPAFTVPELTHMRCHGLFLGLGFAWIQIHRPELWKSIGAMATPLWLAGVVATLALMATMPSAPSRWLFVAAPTVGTWALALVFLPCVHEASKLSRIQFRGLRYLGELTYAVYLTHDNLPREVVDLGGSAGSLRGALWRLGLVFAASCLLHHLVERPALWIRQRLLASWGRPRPAAVSQP